MPLGTVDRTPPPFFKQGTPALTKLLVLSALAILLMVVDTRLRWAAPLRAAIATVLYPVQWLTLQPVRGVQWLADHFASLQAAQRDAREAREQLAQLAQRAGLVEHLAHENRELRRLLGLRERVAPAGFGAEILYALPDPYTPSVVIDRGALAGVQEGSAVMDGFGVLGQATRVYPATSEVTLIVHKRLAVPVLNTRTGERYLAYGNGDRDDPALSLRFVPLQTATRAGDALVTSGIDGLYPPGLPVGTVRAVSTEGEEGFARVDVEPAARTRDALHVLVLPPAHRETPRAEVAR